MEMKEIGSYLFLLGIAIAIIAGLAVDYLVGYATGIAIALVLIGIVVGLLNIEAKEVTGFLIAAIALMVGGAAGFGAIPLVGVYLKAIFFNLSTLVAPAAVIVAVKEIYKFAKD